MLFLVFSYIFGYILFCRAVDTPDFASFKKTSKRYKEIGAIRSHYEECDASYKSAAKYPYRDLSEYLHYRGLEHLEKKLPFWNDRKIHGNSGGIFYINRLKLNIEFLFPRQYIIIQKQEAHNMLSSSMWHALTIIMILSSIVFFSRYFTLILLLFNIFGQNKIFHESLMLPYFLLPHFSILITCYLLRRWIESFFHRQRLMELISILETAYLADTLWPDLNIFNAESSETQK